MMKKTLNWRVGFLGMGIFILSGLASAQDYPSKPIVLVVPNPPGGFVDASARLL